MKTPSAAVQLPLSGMGGIAGFYEARTDRVLCVRCAGTRSSAWSRRLSVAATVPRRIVAESRRSDIDMAERRVSYPVSVSMPRKRRANEPPLYQPG